MSTPNKKLGSFIQRLYSLKFPAPKLEMYQGKYNVGRDLHCLEGEGVELQGFEEDGVDMISSNCSQQTRYKKTSLMPLLDFFTLLSL